MVDRRRRHTGKQIALAVGVSAATVSRILRRQSAEGPALQIAVGRTGNLWRQSALCVALHGVVSNQSTRQL
ncbi:hypothetical protein [Bradyrhizobium ivorense]|uniref:hypothetical protein n=1 Tax=Bradyrhizobium ivorense TaxID=2511166 RepID=UPI0035570779